MQKLSRKKERFYSRKDATSMVTLPLSIGRVQRFFTRWRDVIGLKILKQIALKTQMVSVPPNVVLALNTLLKQ
jgi:hypothetical protein